MDTRPVLKALTLYQPWASLIVDGRKLIETRPRPWAYVGNFAVHAGAHVDRAACLQFGYDPATIPTSAVVGFVEKYGCVQFPHVDAPPDEYGNFDAGRYGYLLRKPLKMLKPIPARGWQGVWEFDCPEQTRQAVQLFLNLLNNLGKVEA